MQSPGESGADATVCPAFGSAVDRQRDPPSAIARQPCSIVAAIFGSMHYADLGTICQVASGPRVRAVGWLAAGHDFARGPLDERVATMTDRLAADGWMYVFATGFHECDLCHKARDNRNVLIPGDDVLYVAPAMITHYMRDHGYLPPAEFSENALRCPEPQSDAYFAALRRFVEIFSSPGEVMTEAQFDRSVARDRALRARHAAEAAVAAKRKGFTWE